MLHFLPQLRCQLAQPLVAHGFALGRIRLNLAAIQADISQLQDAHRLRQQQDLPQQFLELRQERLAKGGDGVVVRMQSARDKANGQKYTLVGKICQLPTVKLSIVNC